MFHSCVQIVLVTSFLQLAGAVHGFHLRMESTAECLLDCGDNNQCRQRDCRIPENQEVTITCRLMGECNPYSHPVSIHRIDVEGDREIRVSNGPSVMPGFRDIQYFQDECMVQLIFDAMIDVNNVVLQCAIYTEHIREFSMAHVLAVRRETVSSVSTSHPSHTAAVSTSALGMTSSVSHPSPTAAISTSALGMTSVSRSPKPTPSQSPATDPEMETSSSITHDTPTSPSNCVCCSTVTASIPDSTERLTVHRLVLLSSVSLLLLLSLL